MPKKIGVVMLSHFARLAPHAGFASGWLEAYETRKGFPRPDYIFGISGGALGATNFVQFNEPEFRKIQQTLTNLKSKQFYTINPKLQAIGALTAAAALTNLLPFEKIERKWLRYGLAGSALLATLACEADLVKEMLSCDAIFSNRNLKTLLRNTFNFDLIFNSPIRMETLAVDINTRKPIITSNHDKNIDIDQFLDGIIDSTRIPGFFNSRRASKGHYHVDGAVLSNALFHLPNLRACDILVVAKYTFASDGQTATEYKPWMGTLQRSWDIVVDELTNMAIEEYRKFAEATGKKLIVVESEEIPAFHFRNPDPYTTVEAINSGYRSFWDVEDEIYNAYSLRPAA